MIYDLTSRFTDYSALHPLFSLATTFLNRDDLMNLDNGRHEIQGDDIYAIVMGAKGKPQDEAKLEVHENYIDVQAVLKGDESIGWKPLAQCTTPIGEYNSEDDFLLFEDTDAQWLSVSPGQCVIFFPEDAHAPMVGTDEIHKVVIKVKV